MADIKTYNSGKVVCIFGGVTLGGFADGTFINIVSVSEGVISQSGADGEIARAMSTDKRHRVTLTLQQTSSSNDILTGFHAADKASGGGLLLPILIEDLSGRSVFAAAQGWVVKLPDRGYGKDIGTREWTIETGEPTINLAMGN